MPEIRVGGEALIPDLTRWRVERVPQFPDVSAHTVAPDWLAEILSPSTRRYDRQVKLARYHTWEVPCVWLVDPADRWVQVLSRTARGWEILTDVWGEETAALPPFEAEPLELGRWWVG